MLVLFPDAEVSVSDVHPDVKVMALVLYPDVRAVAAVASYPHVMVKE